MLIAAAQAHMRWPCACEPDLHDRYRTQGPSRQLFLCVWRPGHGLRASVSSPFSSLEA